MPLPPVTPADLLLINDCIYQNPGFQIQKYRKYYPPSTLNSNQIPQMQQIAQFTIQYGLRASVQHSGRLSVAGMYKICTKKESPEIGI